MAQGPSRLENKATFLFVTREGTTGIAQVTGLVTQLFGPNQIRKPAPPNPPDDVGKPAQLKSLRGPYRDVQFQYKLLYTGENEARKGCLGDVENA